MISLATISASDSPDSQDRQLALELGEMTAFCIADGAGGSGSGAESAQSAVDMFRELVSQTSLNDLRDSYLWHDLVAEIDQAICDDNQGGETTVVAGIVFPADGHYRTIGASVGDSSAWLVSREEYADLSENQSRRPFAGSGLAVPTIFGRDFLSGLMLISSDGLVKYAPHARVLEIVRTYPIEVACEALISAVRMPSGDLWDDTSIILIDCS